MFSILCLVSSTLLQSNLLFFVEGGERFFHELLQGSFSLVPDFYLVRMVHFEEVIRKTQPIPSKMYLHLQTCSLKKLGNSLMKVSQKNHVCFESLVQKVIYETYILESKKKRHSYFI